MHYRLAPARSKSHQMLLACLAQCFREDGDFAKDPTGYGRVGRPARRDLFAKYIRLCRYVTRTEIKEEKMSD